MMFEKEARMMKVRKYKALDKFFYGFLSIAIVGLMSFSALPYYCLSSIAIPEFGMYLEYALGYHMPNLY